MDACAAIDMVCVAPRSGVTHLAATRESASNQVIIQNMTSSGLSLTEFDWVLQG